MIWFIVYSLNFLFFVPFCSSQNVHTHSLNFIFLCFFKDPCYCVYFAPKVLWRFNISDLKNVFIHFTIFTLLLGVDLRQVLNWCFPMLCIPRYRITGQIKENACQECELPLLHHILMLLNIVSVSWYVLNTCNCIHWTKQERGWHSDFLFCYGIFRAYSLPCYRTGILSVGVAIFPCKPNLIFINFRQKWKRASEKQSTVAACFCLFRLWQAALKIPLHINDICREKMYLHLQW